MNKKVSRFNSKPYFLKRDQGLMENNETKFLRFIDYYTGISYLLVLFRAKKRRSWMHKLRYFDV